jgi:hypothetical protein
VIFILSKVFLALAIYYFLEYTHLKTAALTPAPQEQVK